MLKIQEYLIKNGVDKLEEEFGIIVKRYEYFNVYNYSQTESPKMNPIVQECRGLILANNTTYDVLCRGFDRFFNNGEADTFVENIEDYTILEKYDGSLIQIWYNPYSRKWQASTRGTAYAESETPYGRTFNEIVEGCFELGVHGHFNGMPANKTFIFEVIGPENRVVKAYDKPSLVLLGIRENLNGLYYDYEELKIVHGSLFYENCDVTLAEKYTFESLNDIMKNIQDLNATDEGYVLWNEKTGHRVKIKNPSYVAIHHLRNNGSLCPKNILILVRANEHEEYLSYFDMDIPFFDPYIKAYEKFINHLKNTWQNVKHIQDQKEFALKVKDLPYSGVMFGLKKGNDLNDLVMNIKSKHLLTMVDKFKEK